MGLSLSRSLESTKHQTDLCLICEFCLKVASMFRKYNIKCLSSSLSYSGCTELWERSRTSRSTPRFPCCRSFPSIARWIGGTRDFASGRLSTPLDLDASRTDESTFGLLPGGTDLTVSGWTESDTMTILINFHDPMSFQSVCGGGRRTVQLSVKTVNVQQNREYEKLCCFTPPTSSNVKYLNVKRVHLWGKSDYSKNMLTYYLRVAVQEMSDRSSWCGEEGWKNE